MLSTCTWQKNTSYKQPNAPTHYKVIHHYVISHTPFDHSTSMPQHTRKMHPKKHENLLHFILSMCFDVINYLCIRKKKHYINTPLVPPPNYNIHHSTIALHWFTSHCLFHYGGSLYTPWFWKGTSSTLKNEVMYAIWQTSCLFKSTWVL